MVPQLDKYYPYADAVKGNNNAFLQNDGVFINHKYFEKVQIDVCDLVNINMWPYDLFVPNWPPWRTRTSKLWLIK